MDAGGYSKSLKQELGKFNSNSEIMVKSMMEGSEKKMEKHHRLIDENLSSQERKLQRRLEERSRSKSRKKVSN